MNAYDRWIRLKDIIDQRRINARRIAEQRTEELHAISPELCAIDEELRGTGLRIMESRKNAESIQAIRDRNLELNKKRHEIIASLGFPEDYADVKYTCPDCKDSGFLPDTKICSCLKKLVVLDNIKNSGMGNLIDEQSFENFNMSVYRNDPEAFAAMEYAVKVAKAYADGFGGRYKGKNLLFIGRTGTGKTHISTSIARVIIEKGFDVLYESAQNIIDSFENDKFRSGYGQYEPTSTKYLECDLLRLDDLGTEFSTQFAVSVIYNLITTRKNKGLSTIISTNLSAEELTKRYDDRIYSRIVGSDYTTLYFSGSDYRLFGAK